MAKKQPTLSKQEATDMNGMGLYVRNKYDELYSAFLKAPDSIKGGYCESDERSYELIELATKCFKLESIKANRLSALSLLIGAEINYAKRNNFNYEEIENMLSIFRLLKNKRKDLREERKILIAVKRTLEEYNIKKNTILDKAISYHLKKIIERFGNDGVVDIMINEFISYTPYEGYKPKLFAKQKSLWDDADERVFFPLKLTSFKYDDISCQNPERDLGDIDDYYDICDKYFGDVVEYVYEKNRLTHVQKRREFFEKSRSRLDEQKIESQLKKTQKAKDIISRHMKDFYERHNRWYNVLNHHYNCTPGGFTKVLNYAEEHNAVYTIVGCGKRNSTKYYCGYFNTDNTGRQYFDNKLTGSPLFCTKQDAEKYIKEKIAINNDTIKHVEILEFVGIGNRYKEESLPEIERPRFDSKTIKKSFMYRDNKDYILDLLNKGYTDSEIIHRSWMPADATIAIIESLMDTEKLKDPLEYCYDMYKDMVIDRLKTGETNTRIIDVMSCNTDLAKKVINKVYEENRDELLSGNSIFSEFFKLYKIGAIQVQENLEKSGIYIDTRSIRRRYREFRKYYKDLEPLPSDRDTFLYGLSGRRLV